MPFKKQTICAEVSPASIAQAARFILAGQLVAMPTETVYGLAGDATNPAALAAIFAAKERPAFDPLIIHVGTELSSIQTLAAAQLVNSAVLSSVAVERLNRLIKHFWPGPLTILLPRTDRIPDLATAGLPEAGFRSPAHPVALELIAASRVPLAAPSANRFGRISPTAATHVMEELNGRIPMVLDGGATAIGLESTVVRLHDDHIAVLRLGGVSLEDLAKVSPDGLPVKQVEGVAGTGSGKALASPGTTASHYAPRKLLYLWRSNERSLGEFCELNGLPIETSALLFISGEIRDRLAEQRLSNIFLSGHCRSLTNKPPTGGDDSLAAAQALFRYLRELDQTTATAIIAEFPTSRQGLWNAIADRLTRAASR